MDGKQLKNSILQWAIQGKLVPQDPNDEPAIELLHRINPKALPLTDDIPFDIPKGWEWCKLNDYVEQVTDFVASGSFASLRENVKYYKGKNYAILVRTLDLQNNFTKDLVYTDEHGYNFLNNSNLFGGELVLPNIGASIGKVFIVPHLNTKMTLAPNSVMVRFHDKSHTAWFYYLFSSSLGQQLLNSITSSTAQAKFNKTGFRNLFIPIPPLAEQQRIVARIEELMPLVERYAQAQASLDKLNGDIKDKLKKSILQEAIQGKLMPQDPNDEPAIELLHRINPQIRPITEDIPFDIPDNWCWCRLEDVITFNLGKTPERSNLDYWTNACYPWFSIADMVDMQEVSTTKECISKQALVENFNGKLVPKGTLLMSFKLTIGRMSILGVDAVHNEAIISIYPRETKDNILRNYLMNILGLIANSVELTNAIKGSTLNKRKISNLLIPIPPLAEQQRIVARIEELFAIVENIKS